MASSVLLRKSLQEGLQEARTALVSKYLSTPAGRAKLAQLMIQPLRTGLDYTKMTECPFCGIPIISGRPHPDNGCRFVALYDVMET